MGMIVPRYVLRRSLLMGVLFLASACSGEVSPQRTEEIERLRVGLKALADATPEHLVKGRETFATMCALCHGPDAGGSISGPPLVHPFYSPNRHADIAFFLAIQRGVRAHHWRYGDMPAVVGVDAQEAEQVVAYIRYLQRGSGIE